MISNSMQSLCELSNMKTIYVAITEGSVFHINSALLIAQQYIPYVSDIEPYTYSCTYVCIIVCTVCIELVNYVSLLIDDNTAQPYEIYCE